MKAIHGFRLYELAAVDHRIFGEFGKLRRELATFSRQFGQGCLVSFGDAWMFTNRRSVRFRAVRLPVVAGRHGRPLAGRRADFDRVVRRQTIRVFAARNPLLRLQTTRSIRTFSGKRSVITPVPFSREIQLRSLPYSPSLMCSSLCRSERGKTLDALAVAFNEATARSARLRFGGENFEFVEARLAAVIGGENGEPHGVGFDRFETLFIGKPAHRRTE